MRINKLKEFGSGNSLVRIPYEEAKKIHCLKVDKPFVKSFLNYIGEPDIQVTLSNRRTKRSIAIAKTRLRKIIIYKHIDGDDHNLFVFLHELAHILACWHNNHWNLQYVGHGIEFARHFELVYTLYKDFLKDNNGYSFSKTEKYRGK